MIGISVLAALCALPFSLKISAILLGTPVAYAGVGMAYRAASYGFKISGR